MSEMCCTRLTENTERKNYAKNRHLHTIAQFCRTVSSQLKDVSTIGKNLLNSNISSICTHNMLNLPLTAEICWRVWGTPANFNGFLVLASLLHQRCSTDVNQTLHDVWPSPALVYCIYIWRFLPLTQFCQVQNSLCVQVLHSHILATLLHGSGVVGVCQTLQHSAEGATCIRQDGHHVGHRPTF